MPEGDTLRRLASKITERFAGDRVERAVVRDPRLVGVDLVGVTLVDADAYGKHLFVRFDHGRTLHAHLLMTGSFAVGRPSREAEWKRRVDLTLTRGPLVGESVPVLQMIPTRDEHTIVARLGPDLCRPEGPPDVDVVAARMLVDREQPLTASLLDQRNVAGFGNLYVNDVPFIVGVSPFQPVGTLDGLADAIAIGTALIRVNARRGPQNTVGRRLATDARWVHGTGRRPCPVCGERLQYRSEHQTPWRRSITWCPACQPSRERARVDVERAARLIALHPAVKEPYFP
jgi:formamidopyrimidine-DNA glycosylase